MEEPEYMKIKVELIPPEFLSKYNLQHKVYNEFIWIRIVKTMYGLPQAVKLSNNLLRSRLATDGYYELPHTPGLWKHVTRPVWFTLVVDDFGVKYVDIDNAQHLMKSLQKHYEVEEHWTCSLYCGIELYWKYEHGVLDTKMSRYCLKNLQKYNHLKPRKKQDCPYEPHPRKYVKEEQNILPENNLTQLSKEDKTQVQQVVGSFLYYARAVDNTILVALNAIAHEQTNPTEKTPQLQNVT